VLAFAGLNYEWMPAVLFVGFLLYGFIRPLLSLHLRKEIEDEEPEKSHPL
jgi:CDP-diacylglycerol--serine O-phosphatidyltransferase